MSNPNEPVTRLALLSVSDKTGLTEFACALVSHGFSLLSTGGTARALREAGLDVTDVSAHTGFPEIMDGRVKTLHPRIHGGLLGRTQDAAVMAEHGIAPIEIVAVNLYPFEAVTAREDCSREEAIENIDIGGPAMVRASAKNHDRVTVVTSPDDYDLVASELAERGSVGTETRRALAARAYAHTARYDALVASYLLAQDGAALPAHISGSWSKKLDLRYGENPHQEAAFYMPPGSSRGIEQLQGKELSYNNIADADAAMECVAQFTDSPACIIVKHANPCGGAEADTVMEAYDRAYLTDPVSSFGGIIAFNRSLDADTAGEIIRRQFVEVVIAPGFDEGAMEAFSGKPNVRVLQGAATPTPGRLNFHVVGNGLLVQQNDSALADRGQWRCVSERQATDSEWDDLEFAWKMVRMVKSNAIVYAGNRRTLGIGAGQMSRVDSSRIAAWKAAEAGLELSGAAMASDAFFPFRDSIDAAAEAGVGAIIQPGGSMRDEEVITAANEHGLAMIFTGIRHFRH